MASRLACEDLEKRVAELEQPVQQCQSNSLKYGQDLLCLLMGAYRFILPSHT